MKIVRKRMKDRKKGWKRRRKRTRVKGREGSIVMKWSKKKLVEVKKKEWRIKDLKE